MGYTNKSCWGKTIVMTMKPSLQCLPDTISSIILFVDLTFVRKRISDVAKTNRKTGRYVSLK